MNELLPGFDDLPVKVETGDVKSAVRYYLEIEMNSGKRYFLLATHSNGGCEWETVDQLKRVSPLRYKTASGAKRVLWQYTSTMENVKARRVLEWKGKQA